jgi:hypothetical protein
MHVGSRTKGRKDSAGKRSVPRHRVLSRASASRLEREFERTVRRESKQVIREALEEALPEIVAPVVKRLVGAAPLLDEIYALVERAREAVWCSGDPSLASDPLDDVADLLVKAGLERRERKYTP